MSYKLEYLPVAQRDMIEIVRYISEELKNPIAADRLAVRKAYLRFRMHFRCINRSVH